MRIFIADPSPVMRLGIVSVLAGMDGVRLVGQTGCAHEVAEAAALGAAQVVVSELDFPDGDGLSVLRDLSNLSTAPRVLIYSYSSSFTRLLRAFALGAAGVLSKEASEVEFRDALRKVRRGKVFIPPELVQPVLESRTRPRGQVDPVERLTDREMEVLRLIAYGEPNATIADRLGIATATVASHRAKILNKLALRNNADIARFAVHEGLA